MQTLEPGEYQITRDESGVHAERPDRRIVVEPHPKGDVIRVFHRNAIKLLAEGGQQRSRWLVVEHNKTRIYFNDDAIIISHRDIYP
jgi:hypothetical protein